MKLYLTRHGETLENKKKIFQGMHPDGEIGTLSELGEEQAKLLGERLKNEHFDIIYVSDLRCTRQTATQIVKYHPDTPVEYSAMFREREIGSFTGKSYEEAGLVGGVWEKGFPTDTENNIQLMSRAQDALVFLIKKHMDQNVLLVAHGAFNAMIESAIRGLDPVGYDNLIMYNTAVSIFEIKEDGDHTIHVRNCAKHLN
ncbi:histidine phosphatase family protein [Candidatus Woesearchaeota archaeon]|nr:histidine phosphatase family protein [Candidatus Woesearchaeota archaeon]